MFYLMLLAIFLTSCTKDEVQLVEINEDQTLLENRSTCCPSNLVKNGDFEIGTPGQHAFADPNNVTPWVCRFRTADLVGPSWHWGLSNDPPPQWANFSFSNQMAFLTGANKGEVITQEIDIKNYNQYCLELEAARTLDDDDLTMEVIVELSSQYIVCQQGNGSLDCNNGVSCLAQTVSANYPDMEQLSFSFGDNVSAEALSVAGKLLNSPTNGQSGAGILVDNVRLSCTSNNLIDILATQTGPCDFSFEAIFENSSDAHSIVWTLSDGTTAQGVTSLEHSFTGDGPHSVSISYNTFDRCCGDFSIEVECASLCQEYCDLQGFRVDGYHNPRSLRIIDELGNSCAFIDDVENEAAPNFEEENDAFAAGLLNAVKDCYPDCDWSQAIIVWSNVGDLVQFSMVDWPVEFAQIEFVSIEGAYLIDINSICN